MPAVGRVLGVDPRARDDDAPALCDVRTLQGATAAALSAPVPLEVVAPVRLPLAPLEHAVGAQWHRVMVGGGYLVPEAPTVRIAELAGVSRRTVNRWRRRGLELYVADRLAVALGLHPSQVWGLEWWAACAFADLAEVAA